jgi:hypothetical protein
MRRRAFLFGVLALVGSVSVAGLGLSAQERIVLTTPKPQPVQVTGYTISALLLKVEPTAQIVVTLKGEDGMYREEVYEGAIATTLIRQLNKTDLSTRSLNQRIFDRLIADGRILGMVAGTVP